jgi:hypothetical protein
MEIRFQRNLNSFLPAGLVFSKVRQFLQQASMRSSYRFSLPTKQAILVNIPSLFGLVSEEGYQQNMAIGKTLEKLGHLPFNQCLTTINKRCPYLLKI